jgi:hypothetical protein
LCGRRRCHSEAEAEVDETPTSSCDHPPGASDATADERGCFFHRSGIDAGDVCVIDNFFHNESRNHIAGPDDITRHFTGYFGRADHRCNGDTRSDDTSDDTSTGHDCCDERDKYIAKALDWRPASDRWLPGVPGRQCVESRHKRASLEPEVGDLGGVSECQQADDAR